MAARDRLVLVLSIMCLVVSKSLYAQVAAPPASNAAFEPTSSAPLTLLSQRNLDVRTYRFTVRFGRSPTRNTDPAPDIERYATAIEAGDKAAADKALEALIPADALWRELRCAGSLDVQLSVSSDLTWLRNLDCTAEFSPRNTQLTVFDHDAPFAITNSDDIGLTWRRLVTTEPRARAQTRADGTWEVETEHMSGPHVKVLGAGGRVNSEEWFKDGRPLLMRRYVGVRQVNQFDIPVAMAETLYIGAGKFNVSMFLLQQVEINPVLNEDEQTIPLMLPLTVVDQRHGGTVVTAVKQSGANEVLSFQDVLREAAFQEQGTHMAASPLATMTAQASGGGTAGIAVTQSDLAERQRRVQFILIGCGVAGILVVAYFGRRWHVAGRP